MQLRNHPNRSAAPQTRRRTSRVLALSMLTSALVGTGCAPVPPPDTGEIPELPADPAGVTKLAAGEKPGGDAAAGTGLQPLPTPQQVIRAVQLGRRDPFAQPIPTFSPGGTGPDGKPVVRDSEQAATPPRSGASQARATKPGSSAIEAAAAAARPLQKPQDFNITGVIRSGGITEAVVRYGARSGSLRKGDRGGIGGTDLLPSGWRVASVDVDQGQIILHKDGRSVKVSL
jgi:hypothetical protein